MGILEAVFPQHKKVLEEYKKCLMVHSRLTIPSRIIMFIDNQDRLKMVFSSSVSSCINVNELDIFLFCSHHLF